FPGPPRTFWIILAVALFLAVVGIGTGGILGFGPSSPRRLLHRGETRQGQGGMPTAGLSRGRAACSNRARFSSQGYVCYRPAEQHACYLRRMEPGDRESTRVTLSTAELRVSDGHGRGFLGILAGQQVDPSGLGEAVQALCEQTPIFWVRRAGGKLHSASGPCSGIAPCCWQGEAPRIPHLLSVLAHLAGPGKQRLIYLCIDICFPSNVCVSICFYYLPE
uniref:BRICHOS domain containing 5 n=1 Tax=Cairina moschata TaxID=8855 RepID=A0A8C3C8M7_CAIMO